MTKEQGERIGAIIAVLFICLVFGSTAIVNTKTSTVTVRVTGKERVKHQEKSKYLIFTDSETFENTDNIFMGKHNSSDFYGKLKEGKMYEFTVVGFRIPLLSMYRNIVRFQEVKENE